MEKLCVLIRVYDRIEDLRYAVNIIRDTWKNYENYLLVVSNGKQKGFVVDDNTRRKIDNLVELEENAGHLLGNSQLLLSGIPLIPEDCKYTVLLEADTWMHGDYLIRKYINRLTNENKVWASARWFDKLYSVATDFVIVQTSFIKQHIQMLDFTVYPEYYIAQYLIDHNHGYLFITENMPVHVPGYIKKWYPLTGDEGRFNVFFKSRMVTHHIEDLEGGMEKKKRLFNMVAGNKYFKNYKSVSFFCELSFRLALACSYLLPRRNWFAKYRRINEGDLLYQKKQAENIARKKNMAI
ncbi:glycosyltransferase family 2 protein [Mucilaginibacter limnophilus]|uniref:glycosyltransferase family 2 protein n=1 Tax=Mucilaginibacter limnophilus TaxID=1932778 RepID=UPI00197C41FD|nr:glycosyltransferase family 2 protein [Mucilaginibacter limnophilus]